MKKLLIGLACIAAVALVAYVLTDRVDFALIAACVALIVLPPSYDPAILIKEWRIMNGKHPESKPSCFGDWPHYSPSAAAERDCGRCPFGHECFEDTPYRTKGKIDE